MRNEVGCNLIGFIALAFAVAVFSYFPAFAVGASIAATAMFYAAGVHAENERMRGDLEAYRERYVDEIMKRVNNNA